jgi:hypothetical protein
MGLKSCVCSTASAKSGYVTNHGRVWVIGRIPSNAGCSGSGWVQRVDNWYRGLGW